MKSNHETNKKRGPFRDFLVKNIHILASIFIILALFSFLYPFLSYKVKIDGVKTEYFISLSSLFNQPFHNSWIILLIFFMACATLILSLLIKVVPGIDNVCSFILFIAILLLVCSRELLVNSSVSNFYSASFELASGFIVFFLTVACALCFISSSFNNVYTVSMITEDAILIAAAFVFNFIKIDFVPGAGSINLQFLPLYVLALRRNPFHSFICGGIVYGLLSSFTDGYGIQFYPFDYLIAFGSIIFISIFRNKILNKNNRVTASGIIFMIIGVTLSTISRFIGSSISSMIFYNFTIEEAIIYNASYVPISGIAALVVLILSYKLIILINRNFPTSKRIID